MSVMPTIAFRAASTLAIVCLIAPASSPRTQDSATAAPPMPVLAWGACPLEYCQYGNWVARRATLARTDRQADAPVAFRLYRGDKVFALDGVVVTIEPGVLQFFKDTDVINREPGGKAKSVKFKKDDRLLVLRFELESQIAGWFNGEMFELLDGSGVYDCDDDFLHPRCAAKLLKKPTTEWWAQIERKDGSKGWTHDMSAFDGTVR
jgi:hypothetical protein